MNTSKSEVTKLSNIACYDSNGDLLKRLYQWDHNQTITVQGLTIPPTPVFHFCNRKSEEALVVVPSSTTDGITVSIPNILLQEAEPISVYIYEETANDGSRTIHTIQIPVWPRQKPDDYEYEDNVEYISAALLNTRLSNLINELTGDSSGTGSEAELIDIRVANDGTVYQTAGDAVRALGDQINDLEETLVQYIDKKIVDGLLYEDDILYLTANGEIVSDGVRIVSGSGGGGGSGGGDTNAATLRVSNSTGWITKTISDGTTLELSITWSSIEDETPTGDGTLRILVNGALKSTKQIRQGNVTIDATEYISPGTNSIRFQVVDVYGNSSSVIFNVTVVALSISSTFDSSGVFDGPIIVPYTPVGTVSGNKTVIFILDDVLIGTATTKVSNRELTYTIPAQSHGAHNLKIYFEAEIDGETVRSNELYFDMICIEPGQTATIISSPFRATTVPQYTSIVIPYTVYDPTTQNPNAQPVSIRVNGQIVSSITVDRTEHSFTYRANEATQPGSPLVIQIISGATTKTFEITVTEINIEITPETESLALYLTSQGRNNGEENPGIWEYRSIPGYTADNQIYYTAYMPTGNDGDFWCPPVTVTYQEHDAETGAPTGRQRSFIKNIVYRLNYESIDDYIHAADEYTKGQYWSEVNGVNTIAAELTGFNFTSDGWQNDEDGITVLRVSGAARVTIPYKPFERDFRTLGKTIEIEFATRDVLNYDSIIFSCMSGGRGIEMTAQRALLASEQTSIGTQFKENEHVRVSFVIEKRNEHRLVMIYINGIPSGVVQYPSNDDFSQATPVDISIGSSYCTMDIYCIRVYDTNLNRYQILNNWIADTQIGSLMIDRYSHNDVFDEYGNIVIAKLPSDLPYFILEAQQLPQYKGDKKTISGSYVDPTSPAKSFTFTGCQINVQGTSSAPYARKNYDMQFKNGFEMNSGHKSNYSLRENSIPFNRFVLKADVASSEGANNVELVRLYNDFSPFKSAEMQADPRVRHGIDGLPIVVFWSDTETGTMQFMGKYNFNLPKRAPEPYGFSGDMESWEFQNNTSPLMLFKSDYFDETMYFDPSTGDNKELWRYDYEARFPSDEWTNYAKLQEFQSFVYSTYRANATGDALPETWSHDFGTATNPDVHTYTHDTAAYRLDKFKAEFPTYAELDSFIFYYLFTEMFLMVDSRAKNLFIGFNGSPVTVQGRVADRKAVAQPYDMDTAIGTNNEGSLVFDYSREDIDHTIGGANVFNGQDSVLWNNIRDAYKTEITQMYQQLRSHGFNFNEIETRFETHQAKWPEAIWIEDAWFKYILPLWEPLTTDPETGQLITTSVYLPMMQGSKAEQRKWWLTNRFRYMDSKWNAGDALSQVITLRTNAKENITITPYADIYATVKWGSYLVQARGTRNVPITLTCPMDYLNDTETYIYSAPQISSIGDLAPLQVQYCDVSSATRLQSLKLGDADPLYSNQNLSHLSLGTNTLLRTIDVRNCSSLGSKADSTSGVQQTVDISGCTNIEYVYFDGTSVASVKLPNGGILKALHLPSTITNFTIRNQPLITDLVLGGLSNISTFCVENCPTIDFRSMLDDIPATTRLRLTGFYWEVDDYTELADIIDVFDSMRGYGENEETLSTAQIIGTIHVPTLSATQISEINAKYPYLTLQADEIVPVITYKNYDGSIVIATELVTTGGYGTRVNNVVREDTDDFAYTPNGWALTPNGESDPNALNNIVSDRTVYAAYVTTPRYLVRYLNWDNTVLYSVRVTRGKNASYAGPAPTRPSTQQYMYTFNGWSGNETNVTEARDIIATYTQSVRRYTVRFLNNDGTLLYAATNLTYNSSTTYPYETPVYVGENAQNYEFLTWDPVPNNIEDDINCVAIYRDATLQYVKYIEKTIEDYVSETVTVISENSFSGYSTLKTVTASARTIGEYAFSSCANLSVVDLTQTTGMVTIYSNAFSGCQRLKHLIIRSDTVANLSNTSALQSTPIAIGIGGIYVPTNLVDSYKSATNWSQFADSIYPISEYPRTDFSTIRDSWSEIFANEANGTYATKYHIGDTKQLIYNNTVVYMKIIGFDCDELSDNSGNAKITWGLAYAVEKRQMNSTQTTDSWPTMELRTYLRETLLPMFPQEVQSSIKEVKKTYYDATTQSTLIQNDTVWLCSVYEWGLSGATRYHEDSGILYQVASYKDRKRFSQDTVQEVEWWTRSQYSTTSFSVVYQGTDSRSRSCTDQSIYVIFYFCT